MDDDEAFLTETFMLPIFAIMMMVRMKPFFDGSLFEADFCVEGDDEVYFGRKPVCAGWSIKKSTSVKFT